MLFSSSFLLLAIALVSRTSATPSARGPQTAAAYFITDEPTGNQIIAMSIGLNGKLGAMNAVNAGGRGSQGIRTPAPDPLFSQGAVAVNSAAKLLATVNAGSNTVSLFSINPLSPTKLTMIGTPTSSEGEFPLAIAINPMGTMVCVLNGGMVNGVNCFTPDPKLGLVAIPNTLRNLGLTETTPATGPAGTPSTIVFSEDGSRLIVAVKGKPPTPSADGFLATWSIGSDMSLSAQPVKSSPSSGGLMFSLTPIPGTNAFLSADAAAGFDIFNFGTNTSLSATSTVVPIPGQITTCWSSFSPKSGNFYLTDLGGSTVSEVHVDSNLMGTLVAQYPQAAGSGTLDNAIASIGGNDFLYVLTPGANTVTVMSVSTPGHAMAIQSFNYVTAAKTVGLTLTQNSAQGMITFVSN